MKLAGIGVALLGVAAVAIATGELPTADALVILDRVWPILLFVVAVTVVSELAAVAGLFDVSAAYLARLARGRTWALWLLVVALGVAATAFLSLDTTAVLLTPVVVVVARAQGVDPLPFAFTTVWLANTASLVLPVSNLTNLLATERLDHSTAAFVALLGPSALVAVVVSSAILWVAFRRPLRTRYTVAAPPVVADRGLLVAAAVVILVLVPLLVSGLEPWIPACAAAVALGVVFAVRSPRAIRRISVPWQLVVFATGLFLAVGVLESLGSTVVLSALAGTGGDLLALWRLSGIGMLAANVVNNLPAYVALESVADSPARLAALLIGVNAGPLILPWASLATLLWHERLTAVGVEVPWRRYILLGLVGAPLTVALAVLPLALRG